MKNDKHKPAKRTKKPWPTKDAMEQVYELKLWGGDETEFYSGSGSHDPYLINPYVKVVSSFLDSFDEPPVVCDLGCGDFNVGRELVKHSDRYIGVDIVEPLINFNKASFRFEKLEFQCLDIAKDALPSADIVILRQVLQHLSNSEVRSILEKLYDYKYLILTEHIPSGDFIPNIDIISGQGTRLKKQSGLDLTASPFNFKAKEKEILLSLTSADHKGLIETSVFRIQ
ncbi:class I SAM-dependent methyltransferase [Gramella sp. GC03-9]|uniref:Class I SAM-dependent methyltransferase n=1 Tax=Christiangramia oceanisediminis TaxID=2920386 RepID=A0A9X2KW24_9FLAO|nr:class I SAM-dependent methyltransferase [Gramella oceanisediminis]MCP9198839.1 class I SAM-dependent methyltransferase [Gramella oceanisediminis]